MIEKFENFINTLYKRPCLTIEVNNLDHIIVSSKETNKEEYIQWIKEDIGLDLPLASMDYMPCSGLIIDWTNEKILSKTKQYLYGSFRLNDLYTPIVAPSTFWEPYNMNFTSNEEKIDLERLNYFQKSGHGDDGTFGCFYRHPMKYPFPVYFYDNGHYFPMSLDLNEYYNAMLLNNAVVLWQYLYVDTKLIIEKLSSKNCSNWISLYNNLEGNPNRVSGLIHHFNELIRQLPILFPDFDISLILQKLEELNSGIKDVGKDVF